MNGIIRRSSDLAESFESTETHQNCQIGTKPWGKPLESIAKMCQYHAWVSENTHTKLWDSLYSLGLPGYWLLPARRAAPCCVGSIWDIGFDRRVQISAVSEFQRFSSSGLAVIAKKRSKYGKMQGIPNITKGLVLSLTVDPISWGRLTTESSETLSLVKSCRMLSNLVKSCQNFVHSGLKLFQNVQKTKKALQIAKQLPKMPKNCLKCSKF